MIKHGGVDSCPSTPEKLILEQGNSNLPTCRKNVSPSIENTKKGPECLAFGRRAQHLSFKITLKTAIPKILQWNKDQKIPLGTLLFLCFGLCPVPRDFTKLLKVPMSILRCLMIQVIKSSQIFGCTIEETLTAGNCVFFSSSGPKFYDKLQEMYLGSNLVHRISGYGCQKR